MNNLNSIILEGNLTRDPESSMTKNGTPMCKFSIAVNRYYKVDGEGKEEVSFFDITTWAKQAENCGQYLKKGRSIRIVGRLKQDRWNDAEGKARSKIHVIGDHIEFGYEKKTESETTPPENNESPTSW